MTENGRTSVWRRVAGAASGLGDALATPRGVAPDRAVRHATAQGVRA